jgi:small nuclear ribonucleoprotein (snRNP)-like protein
LEETTKGVRTLRATLRKRVLVETTKGVRTLRATLRKRVLVGTTKGVRTLRATLRKRAAPQLIVLTEESTVGGTEVAQRCRRWRENFRAKVQLMIGSFFLNPRRRPGVQSPSKLSNARYRSLRLPPFVTIWVCAFLYSRRKHEVKTFASTGDRKGSPLQAAGGRAVFAGANTFSPQVTDSSIVTQTSINVLFLAT